MSEVHLTINGKSVVAESGQTVLEAARGAGIEIPVLCHHPALSNWGACRMCLVEIEGARGLQTACTYPIAEGMKVETETEQVVNVRRFVLELLFSERNHYCMYCQMSGDCELQDQAYKHGLDHWTYPRPFEKLSVDASRKYFIMDHNRCILCTRCIRACSEVAANHTLNLRNRGPKTMVVADLDVPFGESSCVECGTCLQVCPTGALIDARSAYGGREKDVTHTQTTCMQCSVGCTLDAVTRYQRLLRVDGVFGSDPNDGLLCVDGRFKPLYDNRKRVTRPMMRKDGKLVEVSWDEALAAVAAKAKKGSVLG
ncbi:MAG: 2Fe-2S iron-sulfur cluster-binding protein, partial [Anaerolineae bacterium]|nr:2Fe-2S iron-sulfur cluster-binding protein [Anaerolineae bacterium]